MQYSILQYLLHFLITIHAKAFELEQQASRSFS